MIFTLLWKKASSITEDGLEGFNNNIDKSKQDMITPPMDSSVMK